MLWFHLDVKKWGEDIILCESGRQEEKQNDLSVFERKSSYVSWEMVLIAFPHMLLYKPGISISNTTVNLSTVGWQHH